MKRILREYYIPNVCGVIITTNHKTDGIYLPADDRRHYVAWSDLSVADFEDGYWNKIYNYFTNGGTEAVAAYLASFDLSGFDPKAPPPKTAAFWDIANANRASEDAELADLLDELGNPLAVNLGRVQSRATGDFAAWINDRKNRRQIPHRFENCGYERVNNPAAQDGLWVINNKRQAVYAKATLSVRDRIAAASAITEETRNDTR